LPNLQKKTFQLPPESWHGDGEEALRGGSFSLHSNKAIESCSNTNANGTIYECNKCDLKTSSRFDYFGHMENSHGVRWGYADDGGKHKQGESLPDIDSESVEGAGERKEELSPDERSFVRHQSVALQIFDQLEISAENGIVHHEELKQELLQSPRFPRKAGG
jgi:hypothetical protein